MRQSSNPARSSNRKLLRSAAVPVAIRSPRVLNIRRDQIPPEAVYIGRGTYRGRSSRLANPFVIGPDSNRNEVCDRFEEWAARQPEIMATIAALRGRDLACYCAPYRCHGDFILKVANRAAAPSADAAPAAHTDIHFKPQI